MKARLLAGMTIAGVFGVATASWAGPPPTLIAVEDDQFAPGKAIQLLESSTTWSWADDVVHEHNVREDHKLFRSGPLTSDPTAMATETISVGTFHYYCEKHGSKSGGMDGKVKVKPMQLPPLTDDEFKVRWADGTPDTGNQFDLRWKPATGGKYKPWIKNTDLSEAVFGAGDDPVDVLPGRTYLIQGRSELAANPARHSGWSPKLEVTASE